MCSGVNKTEGMFLMMACFEYGNSRNQGVAKLMCCIIKRIYNLEWLGFSIAKVMNKAKVIPKKYSKTFYRRMYIS